MDKITSLSSMITSMTEKSTQLWPGLKVPGGYKYTVNHDAEKQPAALLYGTWSAVMGRSILGNAVFSEEDKQFIKARLLQDRLADGTFFPESLRGQKSSKSIEYLKLHCYNYATEALLQLDGQHDFSSHYFDKFLDGDFLARWLEQRSLLRPWEESNNMVNVCSYIALCHKNGISAAGDRLSQLLEWHHANQNPRTGGFDFFGAGSKNQKLQSLAGAVHNFHLHLYMGEPLRYENVIARNVEPLLFQGPLTACLSIDFVELACRVIHKADNQDALIFALLYHLNALSEYQNPDGGWFENKSSDSPTSAAGMKEKVASSCSYGTWFRLCSIGMIDITLLGASPEKWKFRDTLGMGYAPPYWNRIDLTNHTSKDYTKILLKNKWYNLPQVIKEKMIRLAVKVIK